MSKIEANVSGMQGITARVVGDGIVATVSGVGPQGPSGTGTWEQIEGKPTEFPPSEHPHVIGDVTGLQSALDSKQAAGSYVLTTDASVTNAREWSAATVSKIDAETGTSTDRKAFSPLRVFQAIAAWWAGSAAKAKLDGIATGATANATDAQLRDRATHTGYQTAATISDFTTAVIAAAPPTTNASLLTSGTLPDARLSNNIARTSDVTSAVAAVVDASPASLDTLRELAQALGDDANFSATVTNALAAKAPLNNPTFTGTVGGVTKAMVGLDNVENTTDASKPVSTAQAAADAAVASAAAADATSKANAAQAAAVQRQNHTGTQAISTVSGLQAALDGKYQLGNTAAYGGLRGPLAVGTTGRPSYYGTFDQNGNVEEWIQSYGGPSRDMANLAMMRGGSYLSGGQGNEYSISYVWEYIGLSARTVNIGFRVATLSDPRSYGGFVDVGDLGNANMPSSSFGGVSYAYKMGRHTVTNEEYCAFLNAVAATDANGLYSTSMGTDAAGGISRSGSPGSYTYAVRENMRQKPATFVRWHDAARYCNWLHNGKPSGAQGNSTTEDGAYTITSTSVVTLPNAGAQYRLPTESEWIKSGRYKGGSTNAGYWTFATQSDTYPDKIATDLLGSGLPLVALSGSAADLTGTLLPARLPATTVTAGSYGSASSVATYTVDATGRLTAAGSTAIAISAGAVSGLASVATSGSYNDLSNKPTIPTAYTLPTASASTLGGVRVGSGISIDGSGIISASAGVSDGSKGDITVSNNGATWTINANAVVTADLADLAVTTAKLANAAVTIAKVSATGTPSSANFLRGDGTWAAAGSTSASDLSSGTLANARMTTRARAAMNTYLWSSFR